jgi:hypothetical protein
VPDTAPAAGNDYVLRRSALRERVARAARSMADRGITPTVARVRAALGGGSPNDLAPALKIWKDSLASAARELAATPTIPLPIADLAQELWQRATVAAAVELKSGPNARALSARSDEVEILRQQLTALRNQLERESILYGELRAQAARHEAIARDALGRLDESEARERRQLRDLGGLKQRVAELEATLTQRPKRAARTTVSAPIPRQRVPKRGRPKAPTPPRSRRTQASIRVASRRAGNAPKDVRSTTRAKRSSPRAPRKSRTRR